MVSNGVAISQGRSAVSNGSKLLAGVDGRSKAARRYRDILHGLADEYGGFRALSPVAQSMARQAAALILRCEQMQGQLVAGQDVSNDALVKITSEWRRILDDLSARQFVSAA